MSLRGLGAVIASMSSGLSIIALVVGLTGGASSVTFGLLAIAAVLFVVGAVMIWQERNS